MNSPEQRRSLEEAIVDTVREPLIVLDERLRVLVASRSFYRAFDVTRQQTEGHSLYELGDGQWNIPALRELLEDIIPRHTTIEEFEVEHDFPTIGRRTMLLNARKVFYEGNNSTSLLVAIEDVTERRALEHEKDELLRQKDLLLQEMNHRINHVNHREHPVAGAHSSVGRDASTPASRANGHVAAVQEQLHPTPFGRRSSEGIPDTACESLAASMMDDQPVPSRSRPARLDDIRAGRQHGPDRHRAYDKRAEARLSRRCPGQHRRRVRIDRQCMAALCL